MTCSEGIIEIESFWTAAMELALGDRRPPRMMIGHLLGSLRRLRPSRCTTHPHSFFGRLTPDERSMWMYKHIDHHLQQFGA